jgi:hypothetical protein
MRALGRIVKSSSVALQEANVGAGRHPVQPASDPAFAATSKIVE